MNANKPFADAIVVNSTDEEYAITHSTACPCGGFFVSRRQQLLFDQQTGKRYDLLSAACVRCNAEREFLFDINSFFGKGATAKASARVAQPPASMGQLKFLFAVCILFALLAIAVLFGALKVHAYEEEPRGAMYFLLGLCALGIWLLLRRMSQLKGEQSGGARSQNAAAAGGQASDMQVTLARLGIPLDFSVTDPRTAMVGGIAKAGIYRGYKSLEANDPDAAIQSFSLVIDNTVVKEASGLTPLRAVAHHLRGTAYERKGMLDAALNDYRSALDLWPDHVEARASYDRAVKRGL